jgi:hypothetical protein
LSLCDLSCPWWSRIATLDLAKRYGAKAPSAPKLQPWGLVIAYVWDPSGVLWHIAKKRRTLTIDRPICGHRVVRVTGLEPMIASGSLSRPLHKLTLSTPVHVRSWVRLGSRATQSRLPLFPQQQTFLTPAVTSEKCQFRTGISWRKHGSKCRRRVYKLTANLQLSALISVELLAFTSLFGAYYYGGVSSPFLPWHRRFPTPMSFEQPGPRSTARRSEPSAHRRTSTPHAPEPIRPIRRSGREVVPK